jgi:hypothetical protein
VHKHTPLPFEMMNGIVVELPDGSSALAVRRMDSCCEVESAEQKSPQLKSIVALPDPHEASDGTSAKISALGGAFLGSSQEIISSWESCPASDGAGCSRADVRATDFSDSEELVHTLSAGSTIR